MKDSSSATFISIQGRLEDGDQSKFADVAIGQRSAVVLLDSPGGNLVAGIDIGDAIRIKGFATAVPNGSVCASACALAWLAGRPRLSGASAKIGFHSAYVDGKDGASGRANALVGAYLNRLGISAGAIVYLTNEGPSGMQWLSFEDAKKFGLEVVVLPAESQTPKVITPEIHEEPVTPPPVAKPIKWAEYGDWIQIYSRAISFDAEELARAYREKFNNVRVFRFANGWFAVILGPFVKGTGPTKREELLARRAIPDDSLLANTDKMVELVSGGIPSPSSTDDPVAPRTARSTDPAMEPRSTAFFNQYLADWSGQEKRLSGLASWAYATEVTYYGHARPRDEVLAEKQAFLDRWPVRRYGAQPGTMKVFCSPSLKECVVSALIIWAVRNPATGATSSGTARYEFRLGVSQTGIQILGEEGTVVSREVRR